MCVRVWHRHRAHVCAAPSGGGATHRQVSQATQPSACRTRAQPSYPPGYRTRVVPCSCPAHLSSHVRARSSHAPARLRREAHREVDQGAVGSAAHSRLRQPGGQRGGGVGGGAVCVRVRVRVRVCVCVCARAHVRAHEQQKLA